MKARHILPALVTSALMSACALTPDYVAPDPDIPQAYVQPADGGESIANVEWFDVFDDPALVTHVETALRENPDRAVALARIAEAREFVQITRSDQYPFVDIAGGASRGRQSQFVVPGADTDDTFSLSAGFTFELDLWRKLARATEAARADLLATEAAYRGITIQLVAEVASTYFLLLDLDARLQISRETVASRSDSLKIIEARYERGTVAEIDANQAQIQLAVAEAAVAGFERRVTQTENALHALRGGFPGPIERGKPLIDWELRSSVPTGLTSELLQRRPDLVATERAFAAETARIGVAEALRWPSVSLTGTLGTVSDELSSLNRNKAKVWDIGTGFLAPVFNSGQLKAQAEAQRDRAEQAFLNYESAVREAFREVEDALVGVRTLYAEQQARGRQVRASRNAARLSGARYDSGTIDYLEVLDSERSLFNASLEESAARQAALVALVRLYEALGGGWAP